MKYVFGEMSPPSKEKVPSHLHQPPADFVEVPNPHIYQSLGKWSNLSSPQIYIDSGRVA